MFRVRGSEWSTGYSLSARVVQAALLVTVLADLGSILLVVRQYAILTRLRRGPHPSADDLTDLWQAAHVQFLVSLVGATLLLGCMVVIWRLRRRFIRSQESLRHVKRLAHDILASMDHGVVTANLDGVVTSINTAASRLLGVDVECVGRSLQSISTADVPLLEIFSQVTDRGQAVRDRNLRIRHGGRTVQLSGDGEVLRAPHGEVLGCVIHLRDVTDRMLLEQRMRRMERFIGLASLASGLHHEIKNPLTALSIHVQLLEENLSNGHSVREAEKTAVILRTEVSRLNGVLENFRNFANLERLALEPTDAVAVVEKVVRLIRPQASEKGVQVSLLSPGEALPRVPLDPAKFEQVILNLVLNAVEAMSEGGRLTLEVSVVEDELLVAVGDTGPGIPPEVQRHLFQPYFSTRDRGTGMGLALSEKLVGQHGGRIDYSTGPAGTTFRVAVPLKQRSGTA